MLALGLGLETPVLAFTLEGLGPCDLCHWPWSSVPSPCYVNINDYELITNHSYRYF